MRAAALVAGGGHFAGVVLTESVRQRAPVIARRVRVFSVLRTLAALVQELNDFQPTVLYGYPGAVTERYLSPEVPALTSQCRRGAFHVNSDWYILEPVDTDYQPVPPRTDRSGKFRQVWSA